MAISGVQVRLIKAFFGVLLEDFVVRSIITVEIPKVTSIIK